MYSHVLMPVDGSELSRKAIEAAIGFATKLHAKLTAYHALEATRANIYGEGAILDVDTIRAIDAREREAAQKYLDEVTEAARAAGLACAVRIGRPAMIYEGIIETAQTEGCDVIFMASHGRGEVTSLLLGSTTLKVLAHTKIPVLVHR